MKLPNAYVCFDCLEIQDRAPRGQCNKCCSKAVWPLARALQTSPLPRAAGETQRGLERSAAVERLERLERERSEAR